MPRTSIDALASMTRVPIRADGSSTRIEPPRNLTKTEATLFNEIVRSLEPKHFAKSDAPLLSRYCKNLVQADIASGHLDREGAVDANGKLNSWLRVQEKLDRTIVALASKLRLCPSARIGPRDAHRRATNARELSYYERMELGKNADA